MKLVSQEEFDAVMTKTRQWAKNHTMFSSATTTAALAAAEFYFNQQGKTIYDHMVETESQDETSSN